MAVAVAAAERVWLVLQYNMYASKNDDVNGISTPLPLEPGIIIIIYCNARRSSRIYT